MLRAPFSPKAIFTKGHLNPRLCGWAGSFARAVVACNASRDQTSITMQRASRARQVNRAQAQKQNDRGGRFLVYARQFNSLVLSRLGAAFLIA